MMSLKTWYLQNCNQVIENENTEKNLLTINIKY